ncbi:PREDICTED: pentatricopeptide repeat-containing protein At2g36730-like [Tarenaya hassleriana]|uniref:pentatricopeptide repeat-containing protein At2g36730-like n=1 Tax=Tarenaya hassleriana TaxID=28532 RepID=UPI00053C167A|nr:PREDICTED: pentatricopeptide repeat-containing protein At2g36730-like [Tarenaya hassleriana]
MVRFSVSTANSNGYSNLNSRKDQLLLFLKLCSSIKHLLQIHAQILISGLHSDSFLLGELVRVLSLSACKNLRYARALLCHSADSTPFLWNTLIRGYSSTDSPGEAVCVYNEMKRRGIRPDNFTFPFLLKACASCFGLTAGRQVHVEVLKHGFDSDMYVGNNLIHFYGSCKKISSARKVFEEMPDRSIVSWNSLITACVEQGKPDYAIEYFLGMMSRGFMPNEMTMVVVLSACVGNLTIGKLVHSQVITRGLEINIQLGTALVDMYGKSGGLGYARCIFTRMGERNVRTWNAMILGLAQNGLADEALELFSVMAKKSSVKPNDVTFLGVLCACSHSGLVDQGYKYFHEMEHGHKIKPGITHYGAMVDMLGRAGRLNEAYTFVKKMPIVPGPIVWRTLLSAFSIHHDKDNQGIGEKVRKKLLELEPRNSSNFVIMANMLAGAGMWDEAAHVRRVLDNDKMKKMVGESCLELGGAVFIFFSGYDSRPDYVCIYELLDWLNLHSRTMNAFL